MIHEASSLATLRLLAERFPFAVCSYEDRTPISTLFPHCFEPIISAFLSQSFVSLLETDITLLPESVIFV